VDDWYDINDDQHLGLHTFATEILTKHQGDVETAKKEVFKTADNYFDHAEKYGFSKLARFGIDRVFRGIKKAQVLFPNKAGGRRERLLNGGEKIISEFNP